MYRSAQLVALIAVGLGACAPAAIAPPLVPGVRTAEDGGQIGTADPFVVIAADPHARWVALCQAREDTDGDGHIAAWSEVPGMGGDALKPYLVFGSGPGVAVDDYLGTDDRGEHIIFVRDGRLLVHHVSAGRTEDPSARGADARDDGSYFDEHRAASLDRARQRLVYHAPLRGDRRSRVIVRDLHSRDGRVLHVVNPPEPAPGSAANQERDWSAVIDLSPPRTPLPSGPLVWRLPSR